MHYDLRLRPAQPPTPAPDAFKVHRREVPPTAGRDGLALVYVHEGIGGYPLLLLHGYPETKRTNGTGPVVLPGAGHFLQWERADLFNALVTAFFGDKRVAHEGLDRPSA